MSESARAVAGKPDRKRGFVGRIALFIRQVIDELRKVVVVVFIVAIMAFTGVLDFAFNKAVMWLFA